jgi:hypothetical protein
MPTARPFAYNTGASIAGTEQLGSLAIGTPTLGFSATGLEWWNGPDEDLGYVIAQSVPGDTQPTPISGVSASVGFFRSSALTENSFIGLANVIAGASGPFASGSSAKTWLNNNGYWTSFSGGGSSTGNYLLINTYAPANGNGDLSFPNHNSNTVNQNPNLVGQSGYAIYINGNDSTGTDQRTVLDQLVGRSGTLQLTQGAISVTYSFTSSAFTYNSAAPYPNQYSWDNQFNGSPTGAITVTSSASGNFNFVDPITITVG